MQFYAQFPAVKGLIKGCFLKKQAHYQRNNLFGIVFA
jgi:hypothetical protein